MSEERKIPAGVKTLIFEIVSRIDPKYRAAGKEALTESWMLDGLEVVLKAEGAALHGRWTSHKPKEPLAYEAWLGCVKVVLQESRGVYRT